MVIRVFREPRTGVILMDVRGSNPDEDFLPFSWDFKALKVHKEVLAFKDSRGDKDGLEAFPVHGVHKEYRGYKELKAHKEFWDFRALKVYGVLKVSRVKWDA
jgi:hypothetical protein